MKLSPDLINIDSKGKWVKAHFIFPEGFNIEDIDVNTPAVIVPLGIESDYLNVFINEDSLVEIEITFSRSAFCQLPINNGTVILTVAGRLTSGQYFYGTDTIKIMNKNIDFAADLALHWLETNCKNPDWCEGLDLNHDSTVNFVDLVFFDGCCIQIINE